MIIPGVGEVSVNEYKWNRPSKISYPGGATSTLSYDPLMRTETITDKDPGQNALMTYGYSYDKMDNIIGKDTGNDAYAYGYDELYRLTSANSPGSGNEAFSYDAVGNRLQSGAGSGTWGHNGNNELLSHDAVSFAYDANGNTIQKSASGVITNYIYSIEDRLKEVRDGAGSLTATYYYDPFGRRLWKEVGGVRTYFHYNDEGLAGEYDAAGSQIKAYGFKPDSAWSSDPLFMKIGVEYYFYHNDHPGTPQKMTAVNGEVVWSAIYSSFGEAQVLPGSTITNNLRFPGQYFDSETGLHYNYHRYYNPATGRYITPDPIGLAGGVNLFAYVDNNPANTIDAFGLYRNVGGGFGVTAAIVSASVSVHTDTCCDDDGRKHIRTIQSVCIGLELGLGLKGSHGANASISDSKTPQKCPKMYDDSGWYSEDSGVWGALIIGRSYSTSDGTGWKVGLGGGWSIYSGCRNDIVKDVVSGKCCNE